MSKKGSIRVHISLHRGRVEFLQREFPKLGYSAIINRLLLAYERKLQKKRAKQDSILSEDDLADLEGENERSAGSTESP